jgi:hypothetical protein
MSRQQPKDGNVTAAPDAASSTQPPLSLQQLLRNADLLQLVVLRHFLIGWDFLIGLELLEF